MISTLSEQTPIRRSGGLPIYLQVSEILAREIVASDASGMRTAITSEGELSKRFKVSRVTIRQALKRLETRGIIYSEKGKGSFPTVPRFRGISGFHSFSTEVKKSGGAPGSHVINFERVSKMPDDMKRHLAQTGSTEGAGDYYFLRRVRSINKSPVAIEDAYLPSENYPGISEVDFNNRSLYGALREYWGVEPVWTDALIEPIAANAEQAKLLNVQIGSPLIAAWRVTLTINDEVVEFVKSTYRGGDFMLHIDRYRIS